jgi:hypothetical protein
LLAIQTANATAILVVVETNAIWIGADGLRSGPSGNFAVCKVHEIYGGILLKYGNTKDHEKTYSTDQDVRDALDQTDTLENFKGGGVACPTQSRQDERRV